MTTLCSAFGVFSAFGAAILAFFAAGGGLQRISSRLAHRGRGNEGHGDPAVSGRALQRADVIVWLIAGVVALAVIVSGIGLLTSFYWLIAAASGTVRVPRWAYACAEAMFYAEAVIVTVITVTAVISTTLAALPKSRTMAP